MRFTLNYTSSVLIAVMMIGSAYSLSKKAEEAEAQIVESTINVPFTGKLNIEEICCNGIIFSLDHPPLTTSLTSKGEFIFQWQNMIPIPTIGWGLYSQWSLQEDTTVLGSALKGGSCITIASECESTESVDFSINQMGTNSVSTTVGS